MMARNVAAGGGNNVSPDGNNSSGGGAPVHPGNGGGGNGSNVHVSIGPMSSAPAKPAASSSPFGALPGAPAPSPSSASGATSPPAARAAQLSFQIQQARSLCSSMLGEALFERCYTYLRDNKAKRRAAASAGGVAAADPSASPPPVTEAEQERTLKSWLTPDQHNAYGHITSLLFCEELLAKQIV
jgi:hypothetical protein